MKKIESLTAKQEVMLREYREEWLAIGRSTAPADRKTAEAAFKKMYAWLGEPEPRIWWFDGPATGSIARTLISSNLGDNLGVNLGDDLKDDLKDNLGVNLRVNLWDNITWASWGSHEAAWPAFYAFAAKLRKMYSEEHTEKLEAWLDISRSCGWWNPFKGIVIACERPLKQQVDEQGRLHDTEGPALLCRDGWPVHAVHGVRVPGWIVDRKSEITVASIDSEQNSEVRRVMLEFFGYERFLRESGAVEIHSDDFGTLRRRDIKNDEPIVMVEVVNSTAETDGTFKNYWLRVPPTITRAKEAVAWTFGVSEEDYEPAIES